MVVGSTEIAGAIVPGFWLEATTGLADNEIFDGRERIPACERELEPLVTAAEGAFFGGAFGLAGGATTLVTAAGLFTGEAADEPS